MKDNLSFTALHIFLELGIVHCPLILKSYAKNLDKEEMNYGSSFFLLLNLQ